MRLLYSKILLSSCVGLLASSSFLNVSALANNDSKILTILHDFSPPTLNPRFTTEATGQRIGMLLFSGLTKLDENLKPMPDLAESWSVDSTGLIWSFKIKSSLLDWNNQPIQAADIQNCIEEYLKGSPISPLRGSFSSWKGSSVNGNAIRVELSKPDPYLPRNLVLLKFFRVTGKERPCVQPETGSTLIGSGDYRGDPFLMNPENSITLAPVRDPSAPKLRFIFVKDETSRVLKLMDGSIDIAQNTLSQTKVNWVLKKTNDYRLLEREGVNVSYLAFNLKNPYLSDVRVRRAIAISIDREAIIREKLKGFVSRAGSFLSPHLTESHQTDIAYDPKLASQLLDEAGYVKKSDGFRFALNYKTTPSRDGIEMAQIFKSMLAKIGIQLKLDIVDLGVFLSTTKKGMFDLYNSRWIGVADGSIFYRTLHSASGDNRVSYRNLEVDHLIDSSIQSLNVEDRRKKLIDVQKVMARDLPYFPLWFWTNALLIRKDLVGLKPSELSLSGGYQPLSRLRRVTQ